MRLDWAIAQGKENPLTPSLARFIKDSREECRTLNVKLTRLNDLVKWERLSRELKISN
jgi:hypothetical protein